MALFDGEMQGRPSAIEPARSAGAGLAVGRGIVNLVLRGFWADPMPACCFGPERRLD